LSVTVTDAPYIKPIYRVPGLPVEQPSLLSKWDFIKSLTGDASGGFYQITIQFPARQFLPFGQFSCWSLNHFNVYLSSAVVTPWASMRINPYERANDATLFTSHAYTIPMDAVSNMLVTSLMNAFQKARFGFSDTGANSTNILFLVGPNTAAVGCYVVASGFIYDERLM
jgi:hypothetical protein